MIKYIILLSVLFLSGVSMADSLEVKVISGNTTIIKLIKIDDITSGKTVGQEFYGTERFMCGARSTDLKNGHQFHLFAFCVFSGSTIGLSSHIAVCNNKAGLSCVMSKSLLLRDFSDDKKPILYEMEWRQISK